MIVLGSCAICAQSLFLREILGILAGTELILGLALASWLFWIGAGGLFGGRRLRGKPFAAGRVFTILSAAIAAAVPGTVLLIRIGRSILVDPPGSMPDPGPAFIFALIVTAPFGILYGTAYNAASAMLEDGTDGGRRGITAAYVLEAAGSILGALMLSLAFFYFMTQLESAFAVALSVTAAFMVTSSGKRRAVWFSAVALFAAGLYVSPVIDGASLSLVFRGYEVEEVIPSRYAELCIAKNRESVSVFSGGARLMSYPDPESAAENVHIPLLAHPDPRRVLMIGGAPGGGLAEARTHPGVQNIDWIELDGRYFDAVDKLVGETDAGGSSVASAAAEARGLIGDGRLLLRGRSGYDMIIVTVPDPLNLRWNRYFTAEFFESARKALAEGGILSLRHGSSENYISDRTASALRIISETLHSVFEYVGAVPGDPVFFISSGSGFDLGEMPLRLESRGLQGRFLALDNLTYRLSPDRRAELEAALAGPEVHINRDRDPILVPYELVLHEWMSGSAAGRIVGGALTMPVWAVPVMIISAALLVCILARKGAAPRAAVFLTGMCSMTVQLSVMLAYQAFSGVLYYRIVVLTAVFMAGAAYGALGSAWIKERGAGLLALSHTVMALIAAIVPLWLWFSTAHGGAAAAGTAGFIVLAASGGILTGMYYRTVVDIAWPGIESAVPALFYSWDMFGACAGGMLAGTLLIPISGMIWTSAAVASVHVAAAVFLTRRIPAAAGR